MPIFRYRCKECDAEFELLLPRYDAPAECPKCGSAELEKALNKVAAISKTNNCAMQSSCPAASAACGCGGCCGHKH
ncbi:MAG: zinc ribbon domain-containing protein [Lentisphaeria bacterium]|nr:zinc ribbon domain-containing protein [Lentisphaeria bacterium]